MYYLKETHSDLAESHNRFIDRYFKLCHGQWQLLEDDGYIFTHLMNHLIQAKRFDIICQLLTQPLWLQSKLDKNKLPTLLSDYILVSETVGQDDVPVSKR